MTTENAIDSQIYRMSVLRRELDYHAAVLEAAIEGYDDLMEELSTRSGDDQDQLDDGDRSQLALWAHRLAMASKANSDALANFAQAAHCCSEVAEPPHIPREQQN